MKSNEFPLEKYFIAYFDILGYEAKIAATAGGNGTSEIAALINTAIQFAEKGAETLGTLAFQSNGMPTDGIKLKVFSDNFFLCTKDNEFELLQLVANIQLFLINADIFIRGALCYGDLFFDSKFVFGPGLIHAYKLESEIAIFPRIVVDDSYIENCSLHAYPESASDEIRQALDGLGLLKMDSDGYRFSNYLDTMYMIFGEGPPQTKSLFITSLKAHKKYIEANLSINTNRLRILQKYQWCKNYHNEFCKQHELLEYII